MHVPNFYVHPSLNRVAELRKDESWIAARLDAGDAVLLPLWQGKSLINGAREAPAAVRIAAGEPWWREVAGETVLLGMTGDTAYFAFDVALPDPQEHPHLGRLGSFADLRSFGPLIDREDGALLAYARGLLWWHQRHRFCGVCGHPTVSQNAGHARVCTNAACATQHFPRTDPAVIVLVHDGDRCLLGRQPVWPSGMHSVLAGFVEPGESLEMAVAREVFEESGVRVAEIAYHSSQPWPFPQSLMIGFCARAMTTEITMHDAELEHCGWYSRDFLASVPADAVAGEAAFALPRRDSIARRMIEDWLAAG